MRDTPFISDHNTLLGNVGKYKILGGELVVNERKQGPFCRVINLPEDEHFECGAASWV